jgi:hypothetical protein
VVPSDDPVGEDGEPDGERERGDAGEYSLLGEEEARSIVVGREEVMNSQFVIEKGIPIPEKKDSPYPFMEMEVGDSFSVTVATAAEDARFRSKVNKKRENRKFICRKVGEGQLRVWRIA